LGRASKGCTAAWSLIFDLRSIATLLGIFNPIQSRAVMALLFVYGYPTFSKEALLFPQAKAA